MKTFYNVCAGYAYRGWEIVEYFTTLKKAQDYAKKLRKENPDEDLYTIEIFSIKVK